MTRTWFRFFSAWQYCMQVSICLTARLHSLCRYGGLVVSAVLVCTEHEGSNPGKDQPAPTTLRRHRAGMPPVASGQTGTASLAVQRPTDCTTVAPVAASRTCQSHASAEKAGSHRISPSERRTGCQDTFYFCTHPRPHRLFSRTRSSTKYA